MRRLAISAAIAIAAQPAYAAEITISDAYHFVDRVGTRSWTPEPERLALTFGVFEINLDSTEGTTGTYEQGTMSGNLFDVSSSINKQFANRLDYDSTLTGSWTLSFENDGDTAVFNTPEVGTADAPNFVTAVSQTGSNTMPTFSFTPPPGVDRIQIQILDLQNARVSSDFPDIIFQENLTGVATTYTVPEGVLQDGGTYSIAFQADTFRPALPGESNLLGRSRVWYDFVAGALPDTGGVPVFLPTTDTTSGTPIFNFDNPVVKNELAYYDPIVAIGYDFALGEGDPFFRSVLLPDIGDGIFELLLPDEFGGFEFIAELTASTEYLFSGEIDLFRILGIETSAGLDPEDSTAFVTGLSFLDSGQFTGTMTPITQEVSPIPVPASGWLLFAGLIGFGAIRKKRGS